MIKRIYRRLRRNSFISVEKKISNYIKSGSIPWSEGYEEYKWNKISDSIQDPKILDAFKKNEIPKNYGIGLDERIVEYPWIISNLSDIKNFILDAGSTFNFEIVLNHPIISNKRLFIYTYHPEHKNFNEKEISYIYGDLRNLPFQNNLFNEIICQSTLEHIGMDNSIYGYYINGDIQKQEKSFEYLKAIEELIRVLKSNGKLLITFPYGKYENHGFFQQFDSEMLDQAIVLLKNTGEYEIHYFKYTKTGWEACDEEQVTNSESFNPHTGVGKSDDGAAHCRAICCIKFLKNDMGTNN